MKPTWYVMIDEWKKVADALNILIQTNKVILPNGFVIHCPVCVQQFGDVNGMIIVEKYSEIAPYKEELERYGYGFSVLPIDPNDIFNLDDFKDILSDWGWSGLDDQIPIWYKEINT